MVVLKYSGQSIFVGFFAPNIKVFNPTLKMQYAILDIQYFFYSGTRSIFSTDSQW